MYRIICIPGVIMSSVSLRLPDDISHRLQELADLTGRSKIFYMIEAIRDHLDGKRLTDTPVPVRSFMLAA